MRCTLKSLKPSYWWPNTVRTWMSCSNMWQVCDTSTIYIDLNVGYCVTFSISYPMIYKHFSWICSSLTFKHTNTPNSTPILYFLFRIKRLRIYFFINRVPRDLNLPSPYPYSFSLQVRTFLDRRSSDQRFTGSCTFI